MPKQRERKTVSHRKPNEFPHIDRVDVAAYRIPTDEPESDGTLRWDHTEMVVVHVYAGGMTGLGWTYAAQAAASLIESILAPTIIGQSAMSIESSWQAMNHQLRNAGRPGVERRPQQNRRQQPAA